MPYIVTTKRPEVVYGDDDCMHIAPEEIILRRAVATLEEARETAADEILAARDAIEEHRDEAEQACEPYDSLVLGALNLPESGGTVGPLPDGTVVEVERTDWVTLAYRAGMRDQVLAAHHSLGEDGTRELSPFPNQREIIAAFNARQP